MIQLAKRGDLHARRQVCARGVSARGAGARLPSRDVCATLCCDCVARDVGAQHLPGREVAGGVGGAAGVEVGVLDGEVLVAFAGDGVRRRFAAASIFMEVLVLVRPWL